jgi:hypothetical protein
MGTMIQRSNQASVWSALRGGSFAEKSGSA